MTEIWKGWWLISVITKKLLSSARDFLLFPGHLIEFNKTPLCDILKSCMSDTFRNRIQLLDTFRNRIQLLDTMSSNWKTISILAIKLQNIRSINQSIPKGGVIIYSWGCANGGRDKFQCKEIEGANLQCFELWPPVGLLQYTNAPRVCITKSPLQTVNFHIFWEPSPWDLYWSVRGGQNLIVQHGPQWGYFSIPTHHVCASQNPRRPGIYINRWGGGQNLIVQHLRVREQKCCFFSFKVAHFHRFSLSQQLFIWI